MNPTVVPVTWTSKTEQEDMIWDICSKEKVRNVSG